MYGNSAQGLIDSIGRIPRGIQNAVDTITSPVDWAEQGLEKIGLHLPGLGGSSGGSMPFAPAQQMNWKPEPNAEQLEEIRRTQMKQPLRGK